MLGKATKTLSPSSFSSMVGHEGAGSNQCQAAGPTCVPDDVIQYHEPLELQQQLPISVLRERLGFKPPQPVVCILVAFHKELEGAHLKQGQAALQKVTEARAVPTGRHGGWQPYLGWQTNAVEALADFRHLLQGQPLSSGLHPVNGTVVKGLTGQIHHLEGHEHSQQGPLASHKTAS